MIESIVFLTFGQLATGILLFIFLVPPSRIGKGFGRFHALLALLFWGLALWGKFPAEFFILAGLLLLAAFFSEKDRLYYPFLFLSFCVSLHFLIRQDVSRIGIWNSLAIHIPPVLVLGASSVAMLLGHWYLVAPKLSIAYLKIVTVGLIVALLIRSGFSGATLLKHWEGLQNIHFFEIYGIFFLQRIFLGLLLTLVLSVLTYFCVRIRSTQSATGILYVVVVFCLIGELIGAYLYQKTGLLF